MKTPVLIGVLAATLALSGYSRVYIPHDKFPQHHDTASDDECHENHHLMPDGDHDCDDPGPKSVPEPGTLGLLALGLGGLALARRRR